MKTGDTSSLCQTSEDRKVYRGLCFLSFLPFPELGKRLALFSKSADTPESLSAEMEGSPQDTTEERQ